ncbi:MAG: DUF3786 domain-containing protein [Dethiobacter sp.]
MPIWRTIKQSLPNPEEPNPEEIIKYDEFPAAADILFDAVAQTYLPTASLYVLGIEAAKRLIEAGAVEGMS